MITIIIGTRPEIIKMAPVIRACEKYNIAFSILHTGQHYSYEMDRVFFEELLLPLPNHNLDVGSGSHAEQTASLMTGIEQVLVNNTPDVVLVQGDTNTVLAGGLVGAKLHIPVGHVEAGLISHVKAAPAYLWGRLCAIPLSALPGTALFGEVLIFFRGPLFSSTVKIPFDLEGYHLPIASFIAKSLRNGEFPLWDRSRLCPHRGRGQVAQPLWRLSHRGLLEQPRPEGPHRHRSRRRGGRRGRAHPHALRVPDGRCNRLPALRLPRPAGNGPPEDQSAPHGWPRESPLPPFQHPSVPVEESVRRVGR